MSETRASGEFVVEAQEVIDALNRDLLRAERTARGGHEVAPDVVNGLFRSAHSLKGLSGMFGVAAVARLAHGLEGVLDGMRLGRIGVRAAAFDELFACTERLQAEMAAAAAGTAPDAAALDAMVARLARLAEGEGASTPVTVAQCGLSAAMLGVLTEYEEHRIGETLARGWGLYLLRMAFDLASFDVGLAELEAALRGVGEIITKLPSSVEGEPGKIGFEVVVGAAGGLAAVRGALGDLAVGVVELQSGRGSGVAGTAGAGAGGAGAPRFVAGTAAGAAGAEPGGAGAPQSVAGTAAGAAGAGPGGAGAPQFAEPGGAGAPQLTANDATGSAGGAGAPQSTGTSDSLRTVAQTVRVDIHRLDRLMNLVGELALTKAALHRISDTLRDETGFTGVAVAMHEEGRNLERRLAALQAGIMEVRMVPLASLFERLVRMARKMGRELGREVRLEVRGENTELDKVLVEDLADPLMHLIRNAIDHGIEAPALRRERGKPAEGLVTLSARAEGSHVVLDIADDGAGIDVRRVLAAAVQRGLVASARAAEMSRREAYNLLFLPGFSTRSEVSEYSGRGVGLDVVKTNIAQLSGAIDVASTAGQGTSFTVTLPITLAIIGALVVEVAGRTYALPLSSVLETVTLSARDIHRALQDELVEVRGSTAPVIDLRRLFALDGAPRPAQCYGVVVGVGHSRLVLLVDELVGQQEIVIKSLGRRVRHVRGLAGATELPGGQTILVIDTMALLSEAHLDDGRVAVAG